MEKLKPCPFCGGKANIVVVEPHTHEIAIFMPDYEGGAFVECNDCTCAISAKTKEMAIEAFKYCPECGSKMDGDTNEL